MKKMKKKRKKKKKKKKEKEKNKAGYTAIPVADGWAGAEMHVFALFDSCTPTD